MGITFEEVKENSTITLSIYLGGKRMNLKAVVEKHLGNNFSLIDIDYPHEKHLHFDNVSIDVLYYSDDKMPMIWRNAKIITHKNLYILQVHKYGIKSNRRCNTRVPVSILGWISISDQKPFQTMIRDVSITGFAITDRKKELALASGAVVSLTFDDITFHLELNGTVVRIEEHDNYTIYGVSIINFCRDYPLYVHTKQRKNTKK